MVSIPKKDRTGMPPRSDKSWKNANVSNTIKQRARTYNPSLMKYNDVSNSLNRTFALRNNDYYKNIAFLNIIFNKMIKSPCLNSTLYLETISL